MTTENSNNETFIDIPNYEGLYQVSNFGRVKALKRSIQTKKGWFMEKPAKILKTRKDKDGYAICTLFNDNHIRKDCKVHRLVLIAFTNKSEETVNHKDGNKTNNHISNLEWCTQAENNRHALKHKLRVPKYGLESPRALEKEKVVEVKKLLKQGKTQKQIIDKTGVSSASIYRIKNNLTYQNV